MPRRSYKGITKEYEPRRKNPISLGSDSNLDNDFKPLKIGGVSTGLEFSLDKIKSSALEFVTHKEKTEELSVTKIKGNQIPSVTQSQLIFQNKSPDSEVAGLWFNIYSAGTVFIKASDSSGSNAPLIMKMEDFLITSDEGVQISNDTGFLMGIGGTAELGETQDVRIFNTSNSNDFFKVIVEDNGVTTISTEDSNSSGTTNSGHMKFEPDGSFLIKEVSSAGADVAGYGQLWVKNDTPNNLYFVNDAGNEVQITDGSSLAGGGGGASALNDLSDVTYSSGDLTISSLDKIITSGSLTFEIGSSINFEQTNTSIQNTLTRSISASNIRNGFAVDANITGAAPASNFPQTRGFYADIDDTASNNASSFPFIYGFKADVTGNSNGSSYAFGAELITTGSDNQYGVQIKTDDSAAGGDIYISSSADVNDYFSIKTIANGATTLSTVDSAGTSANLTLDVDGDITLDADGGDIYFKDNGTLLGTVNQGGFVVDVTEYGDGAIMEDGSEVLYFADGKITIDYAAFISEQSSAQADVAGKGQLWVKNDTPNNLYFTNDAGNDVQITNGSSLAGGGGSSTTFRHIIGGGFNYSFTAGTIVFMPITGYIIELNSTSSRNEHVGFVAPYDGYLNQVIFRSENVCGSTVVGLHKSSTNTENPSLVPSNSVTVDMTVDDTPFKFSFGASASFSAGEILAISFDPTNDANDTNFTVEFIFDSSSGL